MGNDAGSCRYKPSRYGNTILGGDCYFCSVYALIVTEKIHKTILAIVGASTMIVLKIMTQQEAFHVEDLGIDWNVIFLLISMMIIIN